MPAAIDETHAIAWEIEPAPASVALPRGGELVWLPSQLRRGEKVVAAFFVYTAVMLSLRGEAPWRQIVAWCVPVGIWATLALESRYSRAWSRVVRDWALLGLILVAYREVDWFAGRAALAGWQRTWIGWDRFILHGLGLQGAVERLGGVIPGTLEFVYLSLYGIPALAMGALYWNGRRDRIDRYLTTLFLGTFAAYALLPHFPSIAPRIAFPNQDLPHYSSLWRVVNLWLLDHCDIATSVFPSGHVAVAFSSAFGLLRALPGHRAFRAAMFGVAATVYTATIYGRYHYAADGLASLLIAVMAWLVSEAADRDA